MGKVVADKIGQLRSIATFKYTYFLIAIVFLFSCVAVAPAKGDSEQSGPVILTKARSEKGYREALFAGGCFWCLEPPYESLKGVIEASVGYCGGREETASYNKVSGGATNHLETVRVVYDPSVVSYKKLLNIYWKFIDPTDSEGQYDDKGPHYTTAIFYHDETQKSEAEISKTVLSDSGKYAKPIVTKILPASPFFLAEERHQNFYEKRFSPSKTVK